ncbi:hypothetical protein [Candidatus Hakubella thermalkaliphila]|nr:hypothetical protein [Candidatus Hakubella thermalkaliphila]
MKAGSRPGTEIQVRKESPMHRGAPRRMKIMLFSREIYERNHHFI